jgi:hypothetical protein
MAHDLFDGARALDVRGRPYLNAHFFTTWVRMKVTLDSGLRRNDARVLI